MVTGVSLHTVSFAAIIVNTKTNSNTRGPRINVTKRGTTFTVDELPCPECGAYDVIGYLFVNEAGEHMHTHYVCTRWATGERQPCGWHGWIVPGYELS